MALAPPGSSAPWRIRPVVVDTNILLNDLARRVRRNTETALVEAAAIGGLRLFVARHIPSEVEKHLTSYCQRRGLDHGHGVGVWDDTYRPLLRVVEAPHDLADERVARVHTAEPDDAPTAALASLLAPCLALSEDPHLTRQGVGRAQGWLELALVGRTVARGDGIIITGVSLGSLGAALATDGVRALIRADWGPAAAVALGVVAVALLERGMLSQDRIVRAINVLRPALDALAIEVQEYGEGGATLDAAAFPPPDTPDPRRTVAHLLARASAPLSGTRIAVALRAAGHAATPQGVNQIPRGCPAFVEVRRAAWQVGQIERAGMDRRVSAKH